MRALVKGLKVVAGIVAGLLLAEVAFHVRSGGAFPHLNFYEPDSALGVHLAPHAQMQLAFSGNPSTQVATNRLGFRGADWPQAATRNHDILVVGDSQVFGLGVEHTQTFSTQLEAALGAGVHVFNAGVPTYGPQEYTALVERLVAERKPARVVYVLNVANDLFELERPNRERHAVWDGWAVRKETAPPTTLNFPLRRWFMSQSHAVFALRSWLRGLEADDAQFASEGGFSDLAVRAKATAVLQPMAAEAGDELVKERARLSQQLAFADTTVLQQFAFLAVRDKRYLAAMRNLGQVAGDPRDIVQPQLTEAARPVRSTAFHLLFAALAMDKNEAMLTELAKKSGQVQLLEQLARRRELRAELAKTVQRASADTTYNALDDILARTQRACDAVQAELMVVILPLDVQVSQDEWQKYGQTPLDMSATAVLNEDMAARAKRLGARVLDATTALRAVEPGAFLQGDLHMSPRGHAALARAIAGAWSEPLPPLAALPRGRSLVPTADEWRAHEPAAVSGSAPDTCTVKRVREWWRVACRTSSPTQDLAITSMTVLRGGHGDVLAELGFGPENDNPMHLSPLAGGRGEAEPQLIAPVLPGTTFEVSFGWTKYEQAVPAQQHSRTLRIDAPAHHDARLGREHDGPSALVESAARCAAPAGLRARRAFEPLRYAGRRQWLHQHNPPCALSRACPR